MKLYILIWAFGLGVIAGLIVSNQIDRYHQRKLRRIEAEGLSRCRFIDLEEAKARGDMLLGFPIIPSMEITKGEIRFGRVEDIRWP